MSPTKAPVESSAAFDSSAHSGRAMMTTRISARMPISTLAKGKAALDAGRIDGASEIGIFHTIMLPLAVPGAITMGIFAFVGSWNNFFTPFIMITSIEKYTLPMLVQTMRGDVYRTEYGAIYLGLAMTVVPIIILYAIFSRYIVSGISLGAVKD